MTTPPACAPCWTSTARSAAPTCPSSSCCTPFAPVSPPSRRSLAGPSGTTWPPTPRGRRPSTRRWPPTWRSGRPTSLRPTIGDRWDMWSRAVVAMGALLAALLREHPDLRGTVLDLPGAAETARTALTAAGLADRADIVASSFFDPLPPGAGGYLLCAVMHDWDDGSARAILRRCAEAAGTHGGVFVVEKFVTDSDHRTEMDLRVLVYF